MRAFSIHFRVDEAQLLLRPGAQIRKVMLMLHLKFVEGAREFRLGCLAILVFTPKSDEHVTRCRGQHAFHRLHRFCLFLKLGIFARAIFEVWDVACNRFRDVMKSNQFQRVTKVNGMLQVGSHQDRGNGHEPSVFSDALLPAVRQPAMPHFCL